MDLYYRFIYWEGGHKIDLMNWWDADKQFFVCALDQFGVAIYTNAYLGKELKKSTMLEF